MDRKSKSLIAIMFIMIIVSAIMTYYRYMILKDYQVIESPIENSVE